MANRLLIAGAGGFGRELHDWVQSSQRFMQEYDIGSIAYINDIEPEKAPHAPIIGSIRDFTPEPGDLVLIAIGSGEGRRSVAEALEGRGARFPVFVHDSVILAPSAQLGEGTVICPNTVVAADTEFGRHVQVNLTCTIGHDSQLGDYATLSPLCALSGWSRVGAGAFLGTGASTLPHAAVGDGASVGAGAVVVKDVPNGVTVVGIPAKQR